jgi:adenylate cyclase
VHFVDSGHVALSFQFFNKTRQNILANPRANAHVIHPLTGERFQLLLEYLRTETEGPLFESMRAKLAGIASHTGMTGVFKLQGADLYRVHEITRVPGAAIAPPPRRNLLAAVRASTHRISANNEMAHLLDTTLDCLVELFGVRHAMVLMYDAGGKRLFTVASRGYAESGIGSEIPLGRGVIGVCAREQTPIRITHMAAEYSYGRAIREQTQLGGLAGLLETEIPLPGLSTPGSQLAAPILGSRRLLGVLFVESDMDNRFGYDEEDALVALATQLGTGLQFTQEEETLGEQVLSPKLPGRVEGNALRVRHFAADDSVFLGDEYLIKGVAGAIFWKLLRDYQREERTEFNNRELRLDPAIRLPDISDNLEARLILLQRRLAERCDFLAIEKTGRGRFKFKVARPVLQEG